MWLQVGACRPLLLVESGGLLSEQEREGKVGAWDTQSRVRLGAEGRCQM